MSTRRIGASCTDMSVNLSSFCHISFQPSPFIWSRQEMILFQQLQCLCLKIGSPNIITIMVAYILVLLPLNVLVLCLSHQRWRRPSSATSMSHSDLFTVHTSIMELVNIFGAVLICSGVYTDTPDLVMVGILLSAMNTTGVMLFHTLTCVERHLAVVHPVTYLGLKKEKGIRIRNLSIGVVWLMSAGACLSLVFSVIPYVAIFLSTCGLVLTVVCFCSLSVLRVLVRAGPADRFGRQQQVDQTKLRAFHTITAILCVLLFKFGGFIITCVLYVTQVVQTSGKCYLWVSLFWFCLPTNLVLPPLFLLRAGKPCCCKTGQQSD